MGRCGPVLRRTDTNPAASAAHTVTWVHGSLLTNREIATLVTLTAFVMLAIVAVVRGGSGGRILQSGRSAFATLLNTKIPLLFAGYVGGIAATVALASGSWLWGPALWKATVLWCLISGIGLFGKAFSAVEEKGVFVGALKRVIAAVVVFEFIANLASFPGELHRWLQVNGHDDRCQHMQPTDGGVRYGSEAEFG